MVRNLILIPNHFFTPSIIEKRRALAPTSQRACWIGCNIDISAIPDSGKIYIDMRLNSKTGIPIITLSEIK